MQILFILGKKTWNKPTEGATVMQIQIGFCGLEMFRYLL